jgi:hypothetical protein
MNNVASILILVFLAISFIQSGMTNYFTGKIDSAQGILKTILKSCAVSINEYFNTYQ